jgi:hypothetical protein
MSLIAPNSLTQQPQYTPSVNWGNPITQGLVFAAIPVGLTYVDVVSGIVSTLQNGTGPPTQDFRKPLLGPPSKFVTGVASALYNRWPTYSTLADRVTGPFTVFTEGGLGPSANGTNQPVFESASSVTGNGLRFGFDDTIFNTNGIYSWVNNNNRAGAGGLGANSELSVFRAAVAADGVNHRFYGLGRLLGTTAATSVPTAGTDRRSSINGTYGGTSLSTASLVLVWNRAIVLPEYAALYENPWQLFKAPSRKIFLSASGGASYSLTCDAGGYALTGNAATMLRGVKLPLAAGSYTLSGTAAVLVRGVKLSLATGTYAVTGNDATLTYASGAQPIGRPDSDVAAGAWTPSTGSDLWAMIDEVSASDADYITTSTASTCEMTLTNTTFPGTATEKLSYRASSVAGSTLTVTLFQGATTIASWSHALTGTITLYEQTLTAPEVANIVAGPISVRLASS